MDWVEFESFWVWHPYFSNVVVRRKALELPQSLSINKIEIRDWKNRFMGLEPRIGRFESPAQ